MADSPSKIITFSFEDKKSSADSTNFIKSNSSSTPPASSSTDPNFGKFSVFTLSNIFPVVGTTFQVDAAVVGGSTEVLIQYQYQSGWISTNIPFELLASGVVGDVQEISLRTVGGSGVVLGSTGGFVTLAGSSVDFVEVLSASITGGIFGITNGTTLSFEINKTEGVTTDTSWFITPPESWKV